eukprot:scaffold23656_cov99-Skeletonema_marinoi.AAC.1
MGHYKLSIAIVTACVDTIMANYSGSLQAVDCHSHSVRYDIALESSADDHLRSLIRSPTTLLRRQYVEQMLE